MAEKNKDIKDDLSAIALLIMARNHYKKCQEYEEALEKYLSENYKDTLTNDFNGFVWEYVFEESDIEDFKKEIKPHKKNGK